MTPQTGFPDGATRRRNLSRASGIIRIEMKHQRVDAIFQGILRHPRQYPVVYRAVRRALLRRQVSGSRHPTPDNGPQTTVFGLRGSVRMQVPQAVRAFEAVGQHEDFVVQQCHGLPFGHDRSAIQNQHLIA